MHQFSIIYIVTAALNAPSPVINTRESGCTRGYTVRIQRFVDETTSVIPSYLLLRPFQVVFAELRPEVVIVPNIFRIAIDVPHSFVHLLVVQKNMAENSSTNAW